MLAAIAQDGRLELRQVAEPTPGPGEILVRVHAAGLNRADRAVLLGRYVVGTSVRAPGSGPVSGPSRPMPMGGELAGEVIELGAGVSSFRTGDRVMGMCRGAFAELARMEAGRAMAVPDHLSWAEAGAVPTTFVTAHDALVSAGRLDPGGSVLVNAASSGVGVAALQLARALGAGIVIACSTRTAKLEALKAAGIEFDVGVVAGSADLSERCLEATGGLGVDVVIDSVGGPAWGESLASAALGGRIVSVGRLGGLTAEVNFDEVARKRVSLVGVTFRTRSAEQAVAVIQRAASDLLPALADGRVKVLVDRTFRLQEVAAAEDYLHTDQHVGKVVLLLR
jgi:NADPH:quinone reductase-like Zn-dependent oxidoreductase